MALVKEPVAINFSQGIDTKSDKWQLPIGKFFSLINSVFTKFGGLTKRNGFANLPNPPAVPDYLTTFNGNLIGISDELDAYSEGTSSYVNRGPTPRVSLTTLPSMRNSLNQYTSDSAISPNGLVCTVYLELRLSAVTQAQAVVQDATTGQTLVAQFNLAIYNQALPIFSIPRVFYMNGKFVILYKQDNPSFNLNYITIDTTTLVVSSPTTIGVLNASFPIVEGQVFTFGGLTKLYIAYNDTGTDINLTYLTSTLVLGPTVSQTPANTPVALSVTGDLTTGDVWVSYAEDSTGDVYSFAYAANTLALVLASTLVFTGFSFINYALTSLATAGTLTVYLSVTNYYGYDVILSNYISKNTITNAGVVGVPSDVARSVGLASKAFVVGGQRYMMALYLSPNQKTLFLISDTGKVISRIAYGNAGNYFYTAAGFPSYDIGLPSVAVSGDIVRLSYLIVDQVESVNKGTNLPNGTASNGVYAQFGVNQLTLGFSGKPNSSVEIGNNLNFSGGFLWSYDGQTPQENNFFLYPDSIEGTPGGGGAMEDQQYFYQVIYSWNDAQGNIFRSAPSIPITVTVTTGTNTGSVLLDIPTLRLSYKAPAGSAAGGVKINVYRWSIAQQIYYQIPATQQVPIFNDPSVDFLTVTDQASDMTVLGNEILYTTGGVVENSGAPSTSIMTIFDNRLWMVDAEEPNLLWFSKQVIEAVPVEMSGFLTYFVAPSLGSQGPTGPVTGLHPMDDKLIIFKENDISYINGSGPDNTGANNNYSQSIFITATSGVLPGTPVTMIPSGLLYQSDKGIWLIDRALGTKYIGAPVENYTQMLTPSLVQPKVVSATVIPDTTQVRFCLDSGVTLLYDYFFDQWGTFTGITPQSSTLYQDLHTYVDLAGKISQETPGVYADDVSTPVNMSFQTGWINLTGLQGYERAYYFYLLGEYFSSHTLQVQLAYDYIDTVTQTTIITPIQNSPPIVDPTLGDVEQWRVFLQRQKCQAFKLTLTEQDLVVGQGLTISGLNMVIGKKKGYPVRRASLSVG